MDSPSAAMGLARFGTFTYSNILMLAYAFNQAVTLSRAQKSSQLAYPDSSQTRSRRAVEIIFTDTKGYLGDSEWKVRC